ncbi:MAG: zf-HC2 domain-containing protein [Edaphobacter sp.]
MNPCNKYDDNILRYLDHELSSKELEDLSAHFRICSNCRMRLEEEKSLSRVLRQTRPLYSSSAELRASVSALLLQPPATSRPAVRLRPRFEKVPKRFLLVITSWIPDWKVLVPAVLAIAICLTFVPQVTREVRAASYVEAAASTHRNYLVGKLPLEIQSDSPVAVSAWLAGKLPFVFRLPASQTDAGSDPAYRLIGARLVDYKRCKAALLIYKDARQGKISLLVASSKAAVVAGGDEVPSKGLIFHYRSEAGFKVITWSNHGLSYALVSAISGTARESCLVCHQSIADHDSFKSR